jgi:hypothetical protein
MSDNYVPHADAGSEVVAQPVDPSHDHSHWDQDGYPGTFEPSHRPASWPGYDG